MPQPTDNLYQQVVQITTDYLGPTAPRFIDRQIHNHIGKAPGSLAIGDITTLIDWTKIALATLTDDSRLIEEYIGRLRALTN
ncbi:MAG: hypothetical protein NVS1B7_6680 [Candidatus Saccharimonadales bacterium]